MLRSRWLSRSMRCRVARYSSAARGALSAMPISALITDSGVRSSCEASAVNSSWRRRECSTGDSARSPMISDPANMASSSTGATATSPSCSTSATCCCSARLWPATSRPAPWPVLTSRNGLVPSCTVAGPPPAGTRLAGSAGAPSVSGTGRCPGGARQTNTGASSTSLSESVTDRPSPSGWCPSR